MQDVTLAALYVSSKMHDTLKKPREILMASYSVRFPEQAAKSKSIVGEIDMDPMVRERGARAPFERRGPRLKDRDWLSGSRAG